MKPLHDSPELRPQKLGDAARAVIVAFNPRAGAAGSMGQIDRLRQALERRGFEAILESDLDRIVDGVAQLQAGSRFRCLVAAGGDGTTTLLANRLPPRVPLALFPLGTENLLARHLGVSADPTQQAEIIASGHYLDIDAGEANGRLFLVMASCGFDADVVMRLHASRKGNIRHWAYARPVLESLARYRYPRLRIRADGRDVQACWAFVFNTPKYALNLPIVDDAHFRDGWLDLCSFRRGGMLDGLRYLWGVLTRRHRHWADTDIRRCREIEITAEGDQSVPFQIDGDPGGQLPLVIRILPQRLRLVVPPHDQTAGEPADPCAAHC